MDYEILEVLDGLNSKKSRIETYHVRCKICGHEKIVTKHNFLKGNFEHNRANCKEDYLDSLIGKKIDDYIIKSRVGDVYTIQCSVCGVETEVKLRCLQISDNHNHDHGRYCLKNIPDSIIKHTICQRFQNMVQRCNNPNNNNYCHYGNRGIEIEYENALDFYLDFHEQFEKLQAEGEDIRKYSFDRIDVNGNYVKENLRLTTQDVQSTNTTRKKMFILEKDNEKVLCDNPMCFGRIFNVNGRSVGNVVRGSSKTAGGWKLTRVVGLDENIEEIINNEGVTTKLITT